MSVREEIPLFKVYMDKSAPEIVTKTLLSGYITQGPRVDEFEYALEEYFGNDRVLSLNSGTSALHLALHLIKKNDDTIGWPGLNAEDEVLTSALTCTATNWPILANNLKIKWVDVDPHRVNININDLKSKLSPTTKVIIFVHWGGLVMDLDAIAEVREDCFSRFGFRPYIIEDCAHAFGALWKNKKLGNHGNICMFSLQAIKHLTTGDGGLLVLPNIELYRRGKLLRWFGIDRERRSNPGSDFRLEADIPEWGFKFHMNDINASIGLANLPFVDDLIFKCRSNAAFFCKSLKNLETVEIVPGADDATSSYWLFSLRLLHGMKPAFMKYMTRCSIVVSQVHKRNDDHSCVNMFKIPLPLLDKLESELVCIPVGWWLSVEDRIYIATCIRKFDEKWGKLSGTASKI